MAPDKKYHYLNLQALTDYTLQDKRMELVIVEDFLAQFPGQAELADHARQLNDAPNLRRFLLHLKPAVRLFGVEELYRELHEAEQSVEGPNPAEAQKNAGAVLKKIKVLIEEVSLHRREIIRTQNGN